MHTPRLLMIAVLLGATACGQSANGPADLSPKGQSRREQNDPVKNAGYAAVMEMVDSQFIKCGDTYTTTVIAGSGAYASQVWLQFSDLAPVVTEGELVKADELNGVTFRGTVDFGDMAMRYHNAEGWSDWQPHTFRPYSFDGQGRSYELQQRKGAWELSGGQDPKSLINVRNTRLASCDEVPAEQSL